MTLRAKWTALLASAAIAPDNVLPSFVGILAELSPHEVKILDRIDEVQVAHEIARQFNAAADLDPRRDFTSDALRQYMQLDEKAYLIRLSNLKRIDLIYRTTNRGDNGEHGENWALTLIGYAFVNACSRPHLLQAPVD